MFHPKGPTVRELAVQALSSTERGYDLLAPKFDYTPFRTPDAVLDAMSAELAPLGPFGAALDLCCGTGAGMSMLRPLCRGRVVGVDFSRGMLAAGRRRLPEPGYSWVRGDVRALPFGPSFDVAVCCGALGHVPERDQPRFAAEVARVLRPGGRFAFVTPARPPVWSRRYWLARGFDSVMHVRNALVRPPFVMYYLTFLLPDARRVLEHAGLRVEVRPLPLRHLHLVLATKIEG
jgi:ubiquinone/menaquinone biosynthesis C-methylase UbiE